MDEWALHAGAQHEYHLQISVFLPSHPLAAQAATCGAF